MTKNRVHWNSAWFGAWTAAGVLLAWVIANTRDPLLLVPFAVIVLMAWMNWRLARRPQASAPAGDGVRLDWSETDRELGQQVWRFIDRMNDLTDKDNADKVLAEFRAAVNPIFDEAIRAKGFRG